MINIPFPFSHCPKIERDDEKLDVDGDKWMKIRFFSLSGATGPDGNDKEDTRQGGGLVIFYNDKNIGGGSAVNYPQLPVRAVTVIPNPLHTNILPMYRFLRLKREGVAREEITHDRSHTLDRRLASAVLSGLCYSAGVSLVACH